MDRDVIRRQMTHAKPINEKSFSAAIDTITSTSTDDVVNDEFIIAIEELSELQKELTKFIRGKGDIIGIQEEIADVYIVLANIQKLLEIPKESVLSMVSVKLTNALINRTNNGGE